MEQRGKQRVVFVGGSHNGSVKWLHPNQESLGFVDVDIHRNSDEFVDYIIESNIEPERRERYYITKIVIFNENDTRVYAAIEHNRLMEFIKNQLPQIYINNDILKQGVFHD